MSDFETPHPNGAVYDKPPSSRPHAPFEFLILLLLVALICIGIVFAWTFIGSKSPERLDEAIASPIAAACDRAQAALRELPNPDPRLGADRVARIRAENDIVLTAIGD